MQQKLKSVGLCGTQQEQHWYWFENCTCVSFAKSTKSEVFSGIFVLWFNYSYWLSWTMNNLIFWFSYEPRLIKNDTVALALMITFVLNQIRTRANSNLCTLSLTLKPNTDLTILPGHNTFQQQFSQALLLCGIDDTLDTVWLYKSCNYLYLFIVSSKCYSI